MAKRSNENTLSMTRTFPCSKERLWQAWSDWESAISWWGPVDWPAVSIEADFRTGGEWRAELRSKSGESLFQSGEFLEIIPTEKIVFTFLWEGDNHEDGPGALTTVVVLIKECEEGAVLEFSQTGLKSLASVDGHQGGWMSTFDRLATQIAELKDE